MQLNPYLGFNGNCAEAFKFYEQVFSGKITFMQTWGDSPACDQMPVEVRDGIMHATLNIGDSVLMGADYPPAQYQAPQGIHVVIHFKDPAEGEQIFKKLSEGGNVQMPFGATFFSSGFGMCADRFGTPWMIHCEQTGAATGS